MRIQLYTPVIGPCAALLEWGHYQNAEAPWPEVALTLVSPSGEPLMRATRSLMEHRLIPLPECLMLHVNGPNRGLFECLKLQKVIVGAGSLIPLGDEMFVTAVLTPAALADLRFNMATALEGKPN